MAKPWKLNLFGRLRVIGPEGSVLENFPTRRSALLLARLALSRNKQVQRSAAADCLWPDDFYDASRLRLRQEISRLRKTLGPVAEFVQTNTETLRLDTTDLEIDLEEFEDAARKSRTAENPIDREALLRRVSELAIEPLLDGFQDDWVEAERHRIQEVLYAALVDLSMRLSERSEFAQAHAIAQRAVVLRPDREAAHKIAESALAMLATKPIEVRTASASLTRSSDLPTGLRFFAPAPTEPIFGREVDLSAAMDRLGTARLVSLIGPGGIGKTRLLLEVCQRAKPQFENRVAFIDLSELDDASLAPLMVLHELRADFVPADDPMERLLAVLPREPFLLGLDNLEHLGTAIKPLVRRILQSCPESHIVATSRVALELAGETKLPIGPLAVPGDNDHPELVKDNPSIRVFFEAAQAAGVSLPHDGETEEAAKVIVKRLEGVPLAIRLAAARTRGVPPTELAERLAHSLDLLSTRSDSVPPRQRSMHVIVEGSYLALPEELRSALARLSVFRGGWTLAAASEVCGIADPLPVMEDLLDSCLIFVHHEGRRIRFRMLEVIREYARHQIVGAEADALRQRHSEWMLRESEAVPEWVSAKDLQTLDELELESDNLREAIRYAMETSAHLSHRFARVAIHFWRYRTNCYEAGQFYREMMRRHPISEDPALLAQAFYAASFATLILPQESDAEISDRAIELCMDSGQANLAAKVHVLLGILAQNSVRYELSRHHLDAAKSLFLDPESPCDLAFLNYAIAHCAYYQGREDEAVLFYQRALAGFEEGGELFYYHRTRQQLALAALDSGDTSLARRLLEGLLDSVNAANLVRMRGLVHSTIGKFAYREGRYDDAVRAFETSRQYARELLDDWQAAEQDNLIGRSRLAAGNLDAALEAFRNSARGWVDRFIDVAVSSPLVGIAGVLAKQGHLREAATIVESTRPAYWGGSILLVASDRRFVDSIRSLIPPGHEVDSLLSVRALYERFVQDT